MRHLRRVLSTSVKVLKGRDWARERLQWCRGDIPRVEKDRNVLIGVPKLDDETGQSNAGRAPDAQLQYGDGGPSGTVSKTETGRSPDFIANEFCRFLHVLAAPQSTVSRQRIQEQLKRDELDTEIVDPYEQLSDLFNDTWCKQEKIDVLRGGVTQSAIDRIYLAYRACDRDGLCLKRKFT